MGFHSGVAKEAAERARAEKEAQSPKQPIAQTVEKKKMRFLPYLFAPPVLMAIALAIFILLARGKAHGADNVIFIDISRSVSAPDYTGKQTEFQKNVKGVEDLIRNHISPGDFIKVMAITEATFSRQYVLIDTRISDQKGQFGEVLAQERLRVPATPAAVREAIDLVSQVIDNLRESLEDMEEVLETLEFAERQKIADEQEIENLRRMLKQMHRPREGGSQHNPPQHHRGR